MVLREVERPLLEVVMQQTNGNQSRAAEVLGINRNTLRKKLKLYQLIRRTLLCRCTRLLLPPLWPWKQHYGNGTFCARKTGAYQRLG